MLAEAAAEGAGRCWSHSLWDQEDIYGAPAVYQALEPKDTDNDMVYLVLGPWHHGQEIGDGSSLGAHRASAATRRSGSASTCCAPFLAHYLKDGAPPMDVAPVTAFETGTEPVAAAEGLAVRLRERAARIARRRSTSRPA